MDEKYSCYDCGNDIEIKDDEVIGGKYLEYKKGAEKIHIFKCDDCFSLSPALTDFQETEVYSRVVGYMRPVQNWNPGKQKEFGDRKTYDLPENEDDCSKC